MPGHPFTFKSSADGQVLEFNGDAKGLEFLARVLTRLAASAKAGARDHDHLATEAWAGIELSANPQSSEARILNRVTIRAWPTSPNEAT
jgi:hypothetical protein